MAQTFRDPVRNINPEILANLELVDTRVYPLPGGTGPKWINEIDPRLATLSKTISATTSDKTVYYEAIASVRDKKTKTFYVAFRETADALYAATRPELKKYPEWLMQTDRKQNERLVFIYMVIRHPTQVAVMRSHEDWLQPLPESIVGKATFDAIWHLLAQQNIIPAR